MYKDTIKHSEIQLPGQPVCTHTNASDSPSPDSFTAEKRDSFETWEWIETITH